MGQPFSVVDVLIPGQPAIDRLPQQTEVNRAGFAGGSNS